MKPMTWGEAFAEIATPHSPVSSDFRINAALQAIRDALEELAHTLETEEFLFGDDDQ